MGYYGVENIWQNRAKMSIGIFGAFYIGINECAKLVIILVMSQNFTLCLLKHVTLEYSFNVI